MYRKCKRGHQKQRKMSAVEREFIFDAVVGFLTSPIWNSPVRTFIEQNSLGMNYFSYIFRIFVQPRRAQ